MNQDSGADNGAKILFSVCPYKHQLPITAQALRLPLS
jgi:hypothetical protein